MFSGRMGRLWASGRSRGRSEPGATEGWAHRSRDLGLPHLHGEAVCQGGAGVGAQEPATRVRTSPAQPPHALTGLRTQPSLGGEAGPSAGCRGWRTASLDLELTSWCKSFPWSSDLSDQASWQPRAGEPPPVLPSGSLFSPRAPCGRGQLSYLLVPTVLSSCSRQKQTPTQ